MSRNIFLYFLISILVSSCNQKPQASATNENLSKKESVEIPAFNADSAYSFTEKQVSFGPRIPNTDAHIACGNYLSAQLKSFGATVVEQEAELKNYSGNILKAKNIIGSFQPENKNRVLLFAHWDTRPYADQDPNPENHRKPIDGANDGAGACGVLLEIARQISLKQPNIGIDIIFFDAEDWGTPAFEPDHSGPSGYCLGSDYWGKNPHVPGYKARYGILLDMVSAPNAQFYKELYSVSNAPDIVRKVWNAAKSNGFDNYFINKEGGSIEDDHIYVIRHTKIPCIDIIQQDPSSEHGFGFYWHTLEDNMSNVSKETIFAVGQTLLHVLYNEKN